ncbi:extracellular solute-binding protein [Bordetella sp. FB-8]|uniref:extracellular solute-binding protein n=1 Tax=Bordetella sp. FB-8 TaxID=1159870 RepID=UPI000360BD97|nr:extracellular solute-binding protein [Bordetella sp. FB-8]
MKKSQFPRVLRAWLAGAALAALAPAAAQASTQIQVWHTLTGTNKSEFEKLVKQYNKEQSGVEVNLRAFVSEAELKQAAGVAIRAKQAPNLMELADNHSPEVVAEHAAIKPLYELLAKYPIKDAKWYLPATTSFVHDSRGHLLAFPWMAEIPLMYYNIDDYKKAGLDPNQPARTWADLQNQVLKIRDQARMDCPFATSQDVMVHIENLAPVNNQALTSNENGLAASKVAPTMEFDMLYMRHLSLMVSWVDSQMYPKHSNDRSSDAAFASGECGILLSGSGAMGGFQSTRGLNFGVAPLPYYPQATSSPGRPFVSGAALWATEGHPAGQDKATADFLAWLSKPVIAAQWTQHTGYLPLTEAAFRASDVSYYNRIPGAQAVIASMSGPESATNRGFRLNHYDRIQAVFANALDDAFADKMTPVAALELAAMQAHSLAGGVSAAPHHAPVHHLVARKPVVKKK